MFEVSPAVDRVTAAAADWATRQGSDTVRPSHWLLALLDDDDGKPAALAAQLGTTATVVRAAVLASPTDAVVAVTPERLHQLARSRSLALRADPTLTTDFVLLAVLEAAPALSAALAPLGFTPDALDQLLRTDSLGWGQDQFVVEPDPAPAAAAGPAPSPPSVEPPSVVVASELSAVVRPVLDGSPGLSAARVVDANLNRVREALRVIDDHCRFVLDAPGLCERTKRLRHRVAAAAGRLPAGVLLAARDTPGDVGTAIGTAAEYDRRSPTQVAAVNLKRLQEALRSAEEFGKLIDPAFAREMEAVRYESYDLERAVMTGPGPRQRIADARLYVLVTAERCRLGLERTVAEAAAGGAQVIQLREKAGDDRTRLALARTVRAVTRDLGVLFVVNDRPDLARLADADGVHLGQDDLAVADARQVVGPDVLVGVSTHTLEQVRQAVADGADYLGVGPTFPSRTKAFDAFPGLEFVRAAVRESAVPAFPLGGIDRHNLPAVQAAGATRVAVSAAVIEADDPRAAAAVFRRGLDLFQAQVPRTDSHQ